MAKIKFTKDHEWISVEGGEGTVGITDYAQTQLGDVVFVELPAVGKTVEAGGEAAVVESVKAASEVYSPVAGTVTAVNEALPGQPGLVNSDPAGDGWFFKLTLKDPSQTNEMMDEDAYKAFLNELH